MMKRAREDQLYIQENASNPRSSISNIIKKIVKKEEDHDSMSDIDEDALFMSSLKKPKPIASREMSKSKALKDVLNNDDDIQYLNPNTKKDKGNLIASKKNLVRKLVSLVKPTTKKLHVGLWKYVIAVNKQNQKERVKAYISKDAQIFTGEKAFKKCKEDKSSKISLENRYMIGMNEANESKLEYWGLPIGIVEGFHKYTKIRYLFEWQISLLKKDKILDGGKSIVYFAPTSGGKSLPAELIMLRNIFRLKKRCLYVLPFVSIVNEKTEYLKRICETSNVRIEPFCSQSESIWTPNVDIAVCTIEKANSLLNKVIEEGCYRLIDIVVIDELHMILDGHRGYQIEYILSKLKALEKLEQERIEEGKRWDGEQVSADQWDKETKKFQIISMSATMGRSENLMKWLDCEIFLSDFRPVPLTEYYLYKGVLYDNKHNPFEISKYWSKVNDQLVSIIKTYFRNNKSVILFCNTKSLCEKYAATMSRLLDDSYTNSDDQCVDLVSELIKLTYNQDKCRNSSVNKNSAGLCDVLKETILKGIAYHHSGLTDEERIIIEKGYRDGHILLIAATSTLSTGINLPAKAVIFNCPLIANDLMDQTHYKQMSGRAGRTGFDPYGESIMILNDVKQLEYFKNELLKPKFGENELVSKIDQFSLRRVILEVIASTSVKSFREIGTFLSKLLKVELIENTKCSKCEASFYQNKCIYENNDDFAVLLESDLDEELEKYKSKINSESKDYTSQALREAEIALHIDCLNCIYDFMYIILVYLKQYKFLWISDKQNDGTLLPTLLGKACFASSIPPEEGLHIFTELFNARLELQLATDLHLCYLTTLCMSPLKDPNWDKYFKRINHLLPDEENLCERVKIDQDYIARCTMVLPLKSSNKHMYLDSKTYSQISESYNVKSEDAEPIKRTCNEAENARRYARFYNALILQDILKETPLTKIASTYEIGRGTVQNLQHLAVNASGLLSCFCERLHWNDLSVLFLRMNERLTMGVQEELLDLMKIQSLKPEKARILFNSDIKSPEDVNYASLEKLVTILTEGESFMSRIENK